MSTQRGNVARTRAQKHKNRTVFKNDLHDKSEQQKRLNSMQVCDVCQHCKSVIEWKIKYKKYKPLTQKKTCARCQQRNIDKAYRVICRDCSLRSRICAKCLASAESDLSSSEAMHPAQQTDEEMSEKRLERLMKLLPERKRRTFQRQMQNGKSADELLLKIEELKLTENDKNEDNSDTDKGSSDSDPEKEVSDSGSDND